MVRVPIRRGNRFKDAIARIRAEFKKRNNQTALEILDSYEEQWAGIESLSDRQRSWVERQLNGTWRAVGSSQLADTALNLFPREAAALLGLCVEKLCIHLEAAGSTLDGKTWSIQTRILFLSQGLVHLLDEFDKKTKTVSLQEPRQKSTADSRGHIFVSRAKGTIADRFIRSSWSP